MKGDDIILYVVGMLMGLWSIRSGIRGLRNRKRYNQAHFIFCVGQLALGIWVLIIVIIIFLKKTGRIG